MAGDQHHFELLDLRELADDLAVDRRLAFGLQHRLVEVEQHLRVERDLLHLRRRRRPAEAAAAVAMAPALAQGRRFAPPSAAPPAAAARRTGRSRVR